MAYRSSVALVVAIVIGAVLLVIELVAGKASDPAYLTGVMTALAAAFLLT